MSITIVPNSAKITVLEVPSVVTKISSTLPDNALLGVSTSKIRFQGDIQLNGNLGDSTKGWRIGWIQALSVETNYAYYRGQNSSDGSIFIQMARPPLYFHNPCRDTFGKVNNIFYKTEAEYNVDTNAYEVPPLVASPVSNAPNSFPIPVQIYMADSPYILWNLYEQNSLTKKKNYIRKALFEYRFCTVLTVQDPKGVFHHQAHIYWDLRAQAVFNPKTYPPTAADWGVTPKGFVGVKVGEQIQGTPTDKRLVNVLTSKQLKSCNDLSDDAYKSLNRPRHPNRHESKIWQDFDFRKP